MMSEKTARWFVPAVIAFWFMAVVAQVWLICWVVSWIVNNPEAIGAWFKRLTGG